MKICTKCKKAKSIDKFWNHPTTKDGLQSQCKRCTGEGRNKEHQKEYAKKYYKNHSKELREYGKEYRKRTVEKRKKYAKKYAQKNREKRIAQKYGLSLMQYRNMVSAQNGKCAICNKATPKLVVDHDHKTNKIRKLLCPKCNTLLGLCGDDKKYLKKLIKYLDFCR